MIVQNSVQLLEQNKSVYSSMEAYSHDVVLNEIKQDAE